VLIPALLPLGIIFTGAALWPFFEQWATGDKSFHHINDRPRNAPVRTGIGVAAILFYAVLLLEGANDVLADRFQIPLYTVTWISRVAVFVLPIGGYFATKRICLGLQRKDANLLTHGVEIGIIRQLPNGEFIEEERPLTEEERAVVESKHVFEALPTAETVDSNGVPSPSARGPMGFARKIANRAFTETIELPEGHGDGHGAALAGTGHGIEGSNEREAGVSGASGEHASLSGGHEEH
jgi:ubiquinol-cytochrome c reductase cytochrome b subunit